MKTISKIMLEGVRARLTLVYYIALTLGVGFLLLYANSQLEQVLSGGEKSRLGLSQTLVNDSEIMLIDEAFSNMDEALEAKIIADLFSEYPDRAVICISHRNASRPFFDRVVEFNA
ncbi:MAG: ATP-binding cassette domain-containing protein [Oscillospiraceae bacterium]|nr:ATP-binding cassette domain-containing protein [Oscillospiraceae bacterium]